MKSLVFLIILSGMILSLSACNTIRGAGEDVAYTGGAIERAATPSSYY